MLRWMSNISASQSHENIAAQQIVFTRVIDFWPRSILQSMVYTMNGLNGPHVRSHVAVGRRGETGPVMVLIMTENPVKVLRRRIENAERHPAQVSDRMSENRACIPVAINRTTIIAYYSGHCNSWNDESTGTWSSKAPFTNMILF